MISFDGKLRLGLSLWRDEEIVAGRPSDRESEPTPLSTLISLTHQARRQADRQREREREDSPILPPPPLPSFLRSASDSDMTFLVCFHALFQIFD